MIPAAIAARSSTSTADERKPPVEVRHPHELTLLVVTPHHAENNLVPVKTWAATSPLIDAHRRLDVPRGGPPPLVPLLRITDDQVGRKLIPSSSGASRASNATPSSSGSTWWSTRAAITASHGSAATASATSWNSRRRKRSPSGARGSTPRRHSHARRAQERVLPHRRSPPRAHAPVGAARNGGRTAESRRRRAPRIRSKPLAEPKSSGSPNWMSLGSPNPSVVRTVAQAMALSKATLLNAC